MRPLHETLNARRKLRGLTYEQVHEALSHKRWHKAQAPSLPTVGHWFNGTRKPRHMEHLRALCDVLDLSLDEVYGMKAGEAKTETEMALLSAAREADDEDVQLALAILRRRTRSK